MRSSRSASVTAGRGAAADREKEEDQDPDEEDPETPIVSEGDRDHLVPVGDLMTQIARERPFAEARTTPIVQETASAEDPDPSDPKIRIVREEASIASGCMKASAGAVAH